MANNGPSQATERPVFRFSFRRVFGFSSFELFATLAIVGILGGLAIPEYRASIDKRKVAKGAEQIVAFVNTVRSESVKRNRKIAVSYALLSSGDWCLGAVTGQTPCNCMEPDATSPDFCAIASSPWQISDDDVHAERLVRAVSGDGSFTVEPIRGGLVEFRDTAILGLQSPEGAFRMNLTVGPTGKPSLCIASTDRSLAGYRPCAS